MIKQLCSAIELGLVRDRANKSVLRKPVPNHQVTVDQFDHSSQEFIKDRLVNVWPFNRRTKRTGVFKLNRRHPEDDSRDVHTQTDNCTASQSLDPGAQQRALYGGRLGR